IVGNREELPGAGDAGRSRGSRPRLAARTTHQHHGQDEKQTGRKCALHFCRQTPIGWRNLRAPAAAGASKPILKPISVAYFETRFNTWKQNPEYRREIMALEKVAQC